MLGLIPALLNALIIGFVARRLLGVPVGWPRTILLSLIVNVAAVPAIEGTLRVLGRAPGRILILDGTDFAISLLVIGWMLVAEVAVLVVLEALVPTGSLPTPLQIARGLPARLRRSRRYVQILAIASRHGLGGYLRAGRRRVGHSDRRTARSLREALTDGGVTFVKLGQMLSTRPDLVSPAYVEELSHLQSSVPPAPWTEVREVIEAELGRPITEVFADIDERPLAAASVAQIHRARLRDGREVVVKVQRPSARRQVTADLDIVLRLADRLDRTTAWGHHLGVRSLAQGFAASLEEELDYGVELANMRAVAASSDEVRVPTPYPDLSSRRLLVMDLLPGRPLSAAAADIEALSRERRAEIAQALLRAVLHQLTVGGVFHADLHPGNIVITADGDVGLLDFGSVGRLDRRGREGLLRLLAAIDAQDPTLATDALLDLLDPPNDLDDRGLEREIGQLLVQYSGGYGPGGTARLVLELMHTVVKHRLRVPPSMAAAFRALGALEGSLQLLDPEFDVVTSSRTAAPSLVAAQLTPEVLRQRALAQLAASLPMLERLPRRLDRITESLETGEFTVRVRAFDHPADRRFVTNLMQQVVVALLAGALAVAGTVLVISDHGLRIAEGLSFFTFVGFLLLLFAFVLGARALVLVFRAQRE